MGRTRSQNNRAVESGFRLKSYAVSAKRGGQRTASVQKHLTGVAAAILNGCRIAGIEPVPVRKNLPIHLQLGAWIRHPDADAAVNNSQKALLSCFADNVKLGAASRARRPDADTRA